MSLQEEEFSLYLEYLKSLPQGKEFLSEYEGNFFEVTAMLTFIVMKDACSLLCVDGSKG